MKKNSFFGSVGAKLALAAMALTSVLFTSCEQEDFDATFELDPAKATIAVSMINVDGGAAMSGFTVTASTGEVSGTTVTITGNKSISAQTVNVTVTYEGVSGTAPVAIPELSQGSVGNYSVTFLYYEVAGEPIIIPGTDTTVTINKDYEVTSTLTKDENPETFYATSGPLTHSHDGVDNWFTNETDYIIPVTFNYTYYTGIELVSVDEKEPTLPSVATSLIETLKTQKINEFSAVFSFDVSAWSIYNALVKKYTDIITYTVNRVETVTTEEGENDPVVGDPVKTEVAVITVKSVSTTIGPLEEPHPSHSHAYDKGHGHSHGHGADNAGGGIVIAD